MFFRPLITHQRMFDLMSPTYIIVLLFQRYEGRYIKKDKPFPNRGSHPRDCSRIEFREKYLSKEHNAYGQQGQRTSRCTLSKLALCPNVESEHCVEFGRIV